MITTFKAVLEAVKGRSPQTVAVAVAQDEAVLEAVRYAKTERIADFILVGDRVKIQQLAEKLHMDVADLTIAHQPDDKKAALEAVTLVSRGEANVLMKGLLPTADLLRAVLDKEVGLRTGRVLSHAAVFEIPGFDRLLTVTDGGMNLSPNLEQKADIIQNTVSLAKALGITPVKVAALAAVEVVNPDMQATLDAALLAKMADRGQIKGAIVDGPLALDIAINVEAAVHKGIKSPLSGCADVLLVPDIVAGNILGKSLMYFAHAKMAGLVLGATRPVVVTSRADSHEGKVLSIALGVLLGDC